jgi:hypothetical protein
MNVLLDTSADSESLGISYVKVNQSEAIDIDSELRITESYYKVLLNDEPPGRPNIEL